jgi:hypothetical protein
MWQVRHRGTGRQPDYISMKPSEVKSIRLQTRVSQSDINILGGRDNVLKLLKAIVRMNLENKLDLIKQYEKQKANYETDSSRMVRRKTY